MFDTISVWLDALLDEADMPEGVAAFGFNLYDDGDDNWSLELVAAGSFDREDEDWLCDELSTFGSREAPLQWQQAADWDQILAACGDALRQYLDGGKYAPLLKEKAAVALGFVDGDLELLYTKE